MRVRKCVCMCVCVCLCVNASDAQGREPRSLEDLFKLRGDRECFQCGIEARRGPSRRLWTHTFFIICTQSLTLLHMAARHILARATKTQSQAPSHRSPSITTARFGPSAKLTRLQLLIYERANVDEDYSPQVLRKRGNEQQYIDMIRFPDLAPLHVHAGTGPVQQLRRQSLS